MEINKLLFRFSDGATVRLFVETQTFRYGSNPFVVKLHFGEGSFIGAGYIGGSTLYLARNSGSSQWKHQFRGQPLPKFGIEFGWTRNANRVPYLAH